MRKFLKFLSQRIVIVTFLIFLQVLWFVGLFLKFTSYSQYITAAFKILSILVVIYIMNRSDNPSVKLVWVIVILLFPALWRAFMSYNRWKTTNILSS